jgi:dipeptidyl aminopeptidase/acylaminoacyl peptidase
MREEPVEWFSEGSRVRGVLRVPDDRPQPWRAIVQGPGWLGLMDSKLYLRYHRALVDAGFATLIFDYRGFGSSEGPSDVLSPAGQLRDLVNAVTYLTTRDDVDADAIGVFGTGGTGGGNAVLLAAADPRIKAAVSQVPVADGADWLHRMRSEHEWLAFLRGLRDDAQQRVRSGHGQVVSPREHIMVPTPERRVTAVKSDVDDRVPSSVRLSSAEEILAYRPIDAARGLRTPLLVIGVEDDATTPTDHAVRLFRAARGPKSLILQRHTSHYAAYDTYWMETTPRIVSWFDRYVRASTIEIREERV